MSAVSMEEEVLKLKEKLSKCQLETDRVRTQKEEWMIKEKLVTQETEQVEEKLRVAKEANLCARSEFEKKKKPLKEALDAKTKGVFQLLKEFDEFDANCEVPFMEARSAAANDKLNRLNSMFDIRQADRDKLKKLRSEIKEKRDKLLAFLKTCVKNSMIIDDVKPLLRLHYDAYIDTLKTDVDDDCEMLREYVHRVLQPSFAQKLKEMFAEVYLISRVSAAVSYIFNFLRKTRARWFSYPYRKFYQPA